MTKTWLSLGVTLVGALCTAPAALAQQPPDGGEAPPATASPAAGEATPAPSAPNEATQDPPAPGETTPAAPDAELEAALAADAASQDATAPAPASAGPSGSSVLNPDISALLLIAAAAYSHDDHVQRGGHAPTENGFNWQELELGLQSVVDPYFRFDSFLSFPAPDEIEIEEAYATTLDLPLNLQAKLGQYLTSFGRQNQQHLHVWSFVDPPLPMSRFLGDGEGLRALGAQVNLLAPLPFFLQLSYNLHKPPEPEEDDEPVPGSAWDDYLQVGRIEAFFPFGDAWSMYLGASAADGPNTEGGARRAELLGADLYVRYKPVTGASYLELGWTTEVMWRRRGLPGPNLRDHGLYTQLDLRFAQRWRAAARFDWVAGALEPVQAGVARSDDTDHPEWRAGASLTFQPTEFSQLRVQYAFDHPDWLSHPIHEAFLQAFFTVGPHGAHRF